MADNTVDKPFMGPHAAQVFKKNLIELHLHYVEDFVGETVTVTNGEFSYDVVTDESFDTLVTLDRLGDWRIVDIAAGLNMKVSIQFYGTYNVTLTCYDYNGWLKSAGLSNTFGSLEKLLEDEKTIRTLITKHASVDYMLKWFETNENDCKTVIETDLVAKWVSLRDYAQDTLSANDTIKYYMDRSTKYGYGEWALMPQVPIMTAYNAPYGMAIVSNAYASDYSGYKMFDGINETATTINCTVSKSTTNVTFGYMFVNPVSVSRVYIKNRSYVGTTDITLQNIREFKIQYSDDTLDGVSGTWFDASSVLTMEKDRLGHYYDVSNYGTHKTWRVFALNNHGDTSATSIETLQFYSWEPKGLVPVMTSNTAPYGEAICSSTSTTLDRPAFAAFDRLTTTGWVSNSQKNNAWIGYKFTNPTMVNRVYINEGGLEGDNTRIKNFRVEASNDGTNWITVYTGLWTKQPAFTGVVYTFNNDKYYMYYRIFVIDEYSTQYEIAIPILQFYGRQLNVSVPAMTSNTAPWGEASASTEYSTTYLSYKAFDNDDSTLWGSKGTDNNCYLQYKFPHPVLLKQMRFKPQYGTINDKKYNFVKSFTLQGSNDGSNWTDLKSLNYDNVDLGMVTVNVETDKEFSHFRMASITSYASNGEKEIRTVNFYGLDYSEHDERHYIYDHGVELEEMVVATTDTIGLPAYKNSDCMYIGRNGYSANGEHNEALTKNKIDCTPYNLLRMIFKNKVNIYENRYCLPITVMKDPYMTNATTSTAYIASDATTNSSKLPYGGCLDISNVNQSGYIGSVSAGFNNTAYLGAEIYEIWLE